MAKIANLWEAPANSGVHEKDNMGTHKAYDISEPSHDHPVKGCKISEMQATGFRSLSPFRRSGLHLLLFPGSDGEEL